MKRDVPVAVDDEAQRALNKQIQRLRQMLALMAPETGTSALGAMGDRVGDVSLEDSLLQINDQRH